MSYPFVLASLVVLFYCGGMPRGPVVIVEEPPWALAIRKRRSLLGLSQEAVAAASGDVLHQATVSRLERGLIHPVHGLSAAQLEGLLRALRWTPEEFTQATGLEIPSIYTQPKRGGDAKPVPSDEIELVPVIGSAAGGRPWPEVERIPIPKRWLRPGSIVFRVEGDSMDNGEEDGIRDGDYVLVDQNLKEFREGKVFLVEIVGDGLTIKRARRTKNGWVLVSDNPKGPILTPDEAKIVGEVYRVISIREV